MRFQTLDAFDKHLRSAFPHLAQIYGFIGAAKGDRDAFVQRLKAGFSKLEPNLEIALFNGAMTAATAVKAALGAQSLFSKQTLIVIDEIDKMRKSEVTLLAAILQELPEGTRVLFSGGSSSGLDALLALEKLVLLDLSKEKPWERSKRVVDQLIQIARREGAELLPDAAQLLVDRIGLEISDLTVECQKLACYVGEKGRIDRKSVEALIPMRVPLKRFKVSQDWVFIASDMPHGDLECDDLLQWLGQMRYHLQVGLKLSLLSPEQQKGEAQLTQMNPKEIGRLTPVARQLGAPYFQKGLELLLETERLAKQGSLSENLLLQHFIGKLDYARKTYSAAQHAG